MKWERYMSSRTEEADYCYALYTEINSHYGGRRIIIECRI